MVVNIRTARVLRPGVNLRDQISHAIGWADRGQRQLAQSYSNSGSGSGSNSGSRLELSQIFQSPWASDEEYETKYSAMMKTVFDLNMDHNTTSLLTMMALFTASAAEMEDSNYADSCQKTFSRLLYRYLTAEVGRVNAGRLVPQYTRVLESLKVMSEIVASKRLVL